MQHPMYSRQAVPVMGVAMYPPQYQTVMDPRMSPQQYPVQQIQYVQVNHQMAMKPSVVHQDIKQRCPREGESCPRSPYGQTILPCQVKVTREQVAHKVVRSRPRRLSGRWYVGEDLGKGGFSWVKKGYDKDTGKVVALKFTPRDKLSWTRQREKQVETEIRALRKLNHPNVVRLLAYNLDCSYCDRYGEKIPSVLIVLEHLAGGDLFNLLACTKRLHEEVARFYFRQLISALAACKAVGVCHRDIKPQNLLLDQDYQLKLADFGLSKIFDKDEKQMNTAYIGTRGYQAPEIVLRKAYSPACDIFSCGVVLFIMLAGYPPIECAPTCRWYEPLLKNNPRQFWRQHSSCGVPKAAKDLITRMLLYEPSKRITLEGIERHVWFQGAVVTNEGLISYLTNIQRQSELMRREAMKQRMDPPLQEGNTRGFNFLCKAFLFDTPKPKEIPPEVEELCKTMQNVESADGETTVIRTDAFWKGDTVHSVARITQAHLRVGKRKIQDCTEFVQEEIWNPDNPQIAVGNVVQRCIDYLKKRDENFSRDITVKNAHVFVEYDPTKQAVPTLSGDERILHTDKLTTLSAEDAMDGMYSIVQMRLGGSVEPLGQFQLRVQLKVVTKRGDESYSLDIKAYHCERYDCTLLRFVRLSGDPLGFIRTLRGLIDQCDSVITGLPIEKMDLSPPKHFLDDVPIPDF